jgi:hypothetical protein
MGEKQTLKSIFAFTILSYCSFVRPPQFKLVYCGILDFQNSSVRVWKCKWIVEQENTFPKCGFYCGLSDVSKSRTRVCKFYWICSRMTFAVVRSLNNGLFLFLNRYIIYFIYSTISVRVLFFIIHLFTCAYIVCIISPPCLHLPSSPSLSPTSR